MLGVLLAAGRGIRMGPLADETPKPLLPVRGKPIIHHVIAALPRKVSKLVIVVGHHGERIRDYCGPRFYGRPITYVEQAEQRGTYHALEQATHLLGQAPFMVLYADDIIDLDTLRELIRFPLAAATAPPRNLELSPMVTVTPSGYLEQQRNTANRGGTSRILTSSYVLTRDIFRFPPEQETPDGERRLEDAVRRMAAAHPVRAVPAAFWLQIGTPDDLTRAEHTSFV